MILLMILFNYDDISLFIKIKMNKDKKFFSNHYRKKYFY